MLLPHCGFKMKTQQLIIDVIPKLARNTLNEELVPETPNTSSANLQQTDGGKLKLDRLFDVLALLRNSQRREGDSVAGCECFDHEPFEDTSKGGPAVSYSHRNSVNHESVSLRGTHYRNVEVFCGLSIATISVEITISVPLRIVNLCVTHRATRESIPTITREEHLCIYCACCVQRDKVSTVFDSKIWNNSENVYESYRNHTCSVKHHEYIRTYPYVSTLRPILQLPTDFTTALHVPFIKLPRENAADVSGLVLIVASRTRRHLSGLPCLPKLESTYEIVTESGQRAQGEGEIFSMRSRRNNPEVNPIRNEMAKYRGVFRGLGETSRWKEEEEEWQAKKEEEEKDKKKKRKEKESKESISKIFQAFNYRTTLNLRTDNTRMQITMRSNSKRKINSSVIYNKSGCFCVKLHFSQSILSRLNSTQLLEHSKSTSLLWNEAVASSAPQVRKLRSSNNATIVFRGPESCVAGLTTVPHPPPSFTLFYGYCGNMWMQSAISKKNAFSTVQNNPRTEDSQKSYWSSASNFCTLTLSTTSVQLTLELPKWPKRPIYNFCFQRFTPSCYKDSLYLVDFDVSDGNSMLQSPVLSNDRAKWAEISELHIEKAFAATLPAQVELMRRGIPLTETFGIHRNYWYTMLPMARSNGWPDKDEHTRTERRNEESGARVVADGRKLKQEQSTLIKFAVADIKSNSFEVSNHLIQSMPNSTNKEKEFVPEILINITISVSKCTHNARKFYENQYSQRRKEKKKNSYHKRVYQCQYQSAKKTAPFLQENHIQNGYLILKYPSVNKKKELLVSFVHLAHSCKMQSMVYFGGLRYEYRYNDTEVEHFNKSINTLEFSNNSENPTPRVLLRKQPPPATLTETDEVFSSGGYRGSPILGLKGPAQLTPQCFSDSWVRIGVEWFREWIRADTAGYMGFKFWGNFGLDNSKSRSDLKRKMKLLNFTPRKRKSFLTKLASDQTAFQSYRERGARSTGAYRGEKPSSAKLASTLRRDKGQRIMDNGHHSLLQVTISITNNTVRRFQIGVIVEFCPSYQKYLEYVITLANIVKIDIEKTLEG
ncbi:hypothetical protein WN51_13980 [Melipona quadrifasciata]|uniref:Uncharacterized protein n=1 Tax=Melipona quadrifasciata TaxID=166423 RepID=A0A0N0U523_9HYME|nr:hypothetical protein WN51_13980 [Melipona quadrifasciata]